MLYLSDLMVRTGVLFSKCFIYSSSRISMHILIFKTPKNLINP